MKRNTEPPTALQALLAEYEPVGFRSFRRMWYRFGALLLLGWGALAALWVLSRVSSLAPGTLQGFVGTFGVLLSWFSGGLLATMLISSAPWLSWARLWLSILGTLAFLLLGPPMEPAGFVVVFMAAFLSEIPLRVKMSSPSLGDSPQDQVAGRTVEALAWRAYWARGNWSGRARRAMCRILRQQHVRGFLLKIHLLRLEELFSDRQQEGRGPSTIQTGYQVVGEFLPAAREAGLSDPETRLLGLLLDALQVFRAPAEEQRAFLMSLGRALGMDEDFVERQIETAAELAQPMSRRKAAEILGVSRDAAPDETETAFRRAAEEAGPNDLPLLAKARAVLLGRRPP